MEKEIEFNYIIQLQERPENTYPRILQLLDFLKENKPQLQYTLVSFIATGPMGNELQEKIGYATYGIHDENGSIQDSTRRYRVPFDYKLVSYILKYEWLHAMHLYLTEEGFNTWLIVKDEKILLASNDPTYLNKSNVGDFRHEDLHNYSMWIFSLYEIMLYPLVDTLKLKLNVNT